MKSSEVRGLFAKHKRKMTFEAILRSLLIGVAVGSAGLFVFSLVYHILSIRMPVVPAVIVFAALTVSAAEICFAAFLYPTNERVAARIDETGLEERAATMLHFRSSDDRVAELQREDAVSRIKKLKSRSIAWKCRPKELILPAACVLLALSMIFLPYNLFAVKSSGEPDKEQLRQQEIVSELIEKLRDEVKRSDNPEELERQLNEIIDQLKNDLDRSNTALDKAAKISKTQKDVNNTMNDAKTKEELGEALQKREHTKELGEAISKADKEKVSEALDRLEEKMKNDDKLAEAVSDELKDALEEADVPQDDALAQALEELAKDLEEQQNDEELEEAIDKAEQAIGEALEAQKELDREQKALNEMLKDAKKELLEGEGKQPSEGEGEQPGEGEGEQGQPGEGEGEGEQGQPGEGQGEQPGEGEGGDRADEQGASHGDGQSLESERAEIMYDPVSGKVNYGKVFAVYYAEYLKALEEGNMSDEVRKSLEEYFSSLS